MEVKWDCKQAGRLPLERELRRRWLGHRVLRVPPCDNAWQLAQRGRKCGRPVHRVAGRGGSVCPGCSVTNGNSVRSTSA